MIPRTMIEAAGTLWLKALQHQNPLKYSMFYNENDGSHEKLVADLGIEESDADWYSAEALMDDAVYLLEEQGLVRIKELADKLMDDESNYEVALTAAGMALIAEGRKPRYRDVQR